MSSRTSPSLQMCVLADCSFQVGVLISKFVGALFCSSLLSVLFSCSSLISVMLSPVPLQYLHLCLLRPPLLADNIMCGGSVIPYMYILITLHFNLFTAAGFTYIAVVPCRRGLRWNNQVKQLANILSVLYMLYIDLLLRGRNSKR